MATLGATPQPALVSIPQPSAPSPRDALACSRNSPPLARRPIATPPRWSVIILSSMWKWSNIRTPHVVWAGDRHPRASTGRCSDPDSPATVRVSGRSPPIPSGASTVSPACDSPHTRPGAAPPSAADCRRTDGRYIPRPSGASVPGSAYSVRQLVHTTYSGSSSARHTA